MRSIALLLACVLLAAWGAGEARAQNQVAGSVFGNGGTPAGGVTGGGRRVLGTTGQAVVGLSSSPTRDLCHGFWCAGGVRVVAVEDGPDGSHAPKELAFGRPSPNPMRDRMSLSLSLPKAAEVRVDLFDVQGRMAGGMRAGRLEPGVYQLEWDGTDGDGNASGPGVYFARLLVDGRFVAQHRFIRLR